MRVYCPEVLCLILDSMSAASLLIPNMHVAVMSISNTAVKKHQEPQRTFGYYLRLQLLPPH